MLSKTQIANLSLSKLGVSLGITDFDSDFSSQAKIIRAQYSISHETLLSKHEWGFATKSMELSLLNSVQINGFWIYNYSQPTDCVTPREISANGNFVDYELYEDQKIKYEEVYSVSGPLIQTEVQDAWLKYTARVDENITLPVFYARALAAQLAIDIAPRIITNNFAKIKNDLIPNMLNDISMGIAEDIGRRPRKRESLSPFVRARYE